MSGTKTISITIDAKTSGNLTVSGGKRLERWVKNARRLNKQPTIEAGFFRNSRYQADEERGRTGQPYVAEIAYINEYGFKNIPERPFFRRAINRMYDDFPDMVLDKLNHRTMRFKPDFWQVVGEMAEDKIKDSIEGLKNPPNAPFTIMLKGFDDPLIETEFMWGSVDHRRMRR